MKKIYLITGATSDIGRALISNIICDPDTFIIATGFNDEDKLNNIMNNNNNIDYYNLDLTDQTKVLEFIDTLSNNKIYPTHFVHLPALQVVNARLDKIDEHRFMLDMNLQVLSALKLCKYFLPNMKKNKYGKLLFMQSSYNLCCPPKNVSSYTMVKSSIGALVKSLAIEYAQYGINVNSVAPSMIETNFLSNTSHLIVEVEANNNPMKRNAKVNDVVPAIQFLLSDEASFITGVTLPITGGSIIL
ncbi:MAG: SDR family oxidoreductase [Clostridia bacterium]|nr:SDR family oxidoreductase [Clostridia bacterium]